MFAQGSLVWVLLLAAFPGHIAPAAAYTHSTIVKQAKLGEQFKLFPGESASIEDTELSLRLTQVRRSWYAKGKSETVDVTFASILNGKEQRHSFRVGKQSKVTVGPYQIELIRANPFGRNDCDFKITRLP